MFFKDNPGQTEHISLVVPSSGGATYPLSESEVERLATLGSFDWRQTLHTTIETTVSIPGDLPQPVAIKSVNISPDIYQLDRESGRLGIFGLIDLVLHCELKEEPWEEGKLIMAGEAARAMTSKIKPGECWDDFFMELLDDDELIQAVFDSTEGTCQLKECVPFYLSLSDEKLRDGQLLRLYPRIDDCQYQLVESVGVKVRLELAVEVETVTEQTGEEPAPIDDVALPSSLTEEEQVCPVHGARCEIEPADTMPLTAEEVLEQVPDLVDGQLELGPELVDEVKEIEPEAVEELREKLKEKLREELKEEPITPVEKTSQKEDTGQKKTRFEEEKVAGTEPPSLPVAVSERGIDRWRRRAEQKTAVELPPAILTPPTSRAVSSRRRGRPNSGASSTKQNRPPSMTIRF